jgi:hypothetical protein
VLIFDEYDMLRAIGLLAEVSMILRAAHVQSFVDKPGPSILIGSFLAPQRFQEDTFVSPFNTGVHIQLEPFDRREAEMLVRRILPALSAKEADALYELVGGQLFLLQCGLGELARGRRVVDLIENAKAGMGAIGDYMRFVAHSLDDETRRQLAETQLQNLPEHVFHRLIEAGIACRKGKHREWAAQLHRIVFVQNAA